MTMSNNVDDYASPRHDYESPKFVKLAHVYSCSFMYLHGKKALCGTVCRTK